MNVYSEIKNIIIIVVKNNYITLSKDILETINCEQPKNLKFGDVSSNVLMVLSRALKIKIDYIEIKIVKDLKKYKIFKKISFANPGFLNFELTKSYWFNLLLNISKDKDYGFQNIGLGKKINIEFVSANPTGPLHIGHARGAVFGDVLSRLLEKNGYIVTKEYYINDLGNQIDNLADTVQHHILNFLNNKNMPLTSDMYKGNYLKDIAQSVIDDNKDYNKEALKGYVTKKVLKLIKSDLNKLGIKFDLFTSEKKIHKKGVLEKVITILKKNNYLYYGVLEKPIGKDKIEWSPKEQLLFRSTKFGDSSDRAVQKNNKNWTYFASDIAYHHEKVSRGYDEIVNVWGADHGGYIKRIEASLKALGHEDIKFTVKLCQIVNLLEKGKIVKMSKRSGNFVLIKDIIDRIGKDVIRFFMLIRKNDAHLDFDLEKCLEETKENPVFYIQYALARINSVEKLSLKNSIKIENYNEQIFEAFREEELKIIKTLSLWPKVIESSVINKEPHRLVYYLIDIASEFHNYWSMGKTNSKLRILNNADIKLTRARLILLKCISLVIKNGFDIIFIKPMEKM